MRFSVFIVIGRKFFTGSNLLEIYGHFETELIESVIH